MGSTHTLSAVPAPLLIADVPWLLYRSYFALPKSIVRSDGQPVNALLGTVNAILSFYDARLPARGPDGVVACMGAEQADIACGCPRPTSTATRCHRSWRRSGQGAGAAREPHHTPRARRFEADDVMFSHARAEEQRGGRALLLTGDPSTVHVAQLLKGGAHGDRPCGGTRALRREPEQVPDFISAATPPTACQARADIGAKTAAELLRAHGSLEALLSAAGADAPGGADAAAVRASRVMRPRVAAALCENAELMRKFERIATLQRIDVEPPRSRATDFAAARLLPNSSACSDWPHVERDARSRWGLRRVWY